MSSSVYYDEEPVIDETPEGPTNKKDKDKKGKKKR